MQTLYIDQKDTQIKVDRDRILVQSSSLPRPISIALQYLSSIVISAKVDLTSHLLLVCAKRGIPVIILDPRAYDYHAQYIPSSSGIAHRKIKQFELYFQAEKRLAYAKQLVYSQSLQQIKLLHYWYKKDLLTKIEFDLLMPRLKNATKMIQDSQNFNELRGLEGIIAKNIFAAVQLLAPEWCAFKGRNRRPPLDPINVLLSLSYSLIHAECSRALQAHAFDPMLGFYHEPEHGRNSLACDLTERLRSYVLKWVLELVLNDVIKSQHFSVSSQYPCTLNKQGRAIYYPVWESQAKLWRKFIRLNVQDWVRIVDRAV